MFRTYSIIASLILLVGLFAGCSDRGITSKIDVYDSGYILPGQHSFAFYLNKSMFSSAEDPYLVRFRIYSPPVFTQQNLGQPYPVLFLLSPFGEDEFFYFNHGLKAVADRLIGTGKIQPMWIVCVNGANAYGGSFYGNSEAGGLYESIIGRKDSTLMFNDAQASLIDYIDAIFNTIPERASRGISGYGMGGYGAFRIASKYQENFSSVSAITAPLDFDGATGNGGLIPYFDDIIANLDTTYRAMDTTSEDIFRTMILAAACSFSPNDTGVVNDGNVITDSTTLLITPSGAGKVKIHLPFDSTGAAYTPIWNLWLANNIETIRAANPPTLEQPIMLINTPEALYGFYQQTLDFHNYLTSQSVDHEYLEFVGYPGYPSVRSEYIYDILEAILIFHSENMAGADD